MTQQPQIGVIMGSVSDWETMRHACDVLDELEIPYEKRVVSAHRTPDDMFEYAAAAEARGLKVIIAGAGGAAHLPGMVASRRSCRSSVCRSNRLTCRGSIHFFRLCKCPPECLWQPWPSAAPVRSTQRSLRRKFWPSASPTYGNGCADVARP